MLSRPFYRLAPSDCVGGVVRQVQCCRAGIILRLGSFCGLAVAEMGGHPCRPLA